MEKGCVCSMLVCSFGLRIQWGVKGQDGPAPKWKVASQMSNAFLAHKLLTRKKSKFNIRFKCYWSLRIFYTSKVQNPIKISLISSQRNLNSWLKIYAKYRRQRVFYLAFDFHLNIVGPIGCDKIATRNLNILPFYYSLTNREIKHLPYFYEINELGHTDWGQMATKPNGAS